MALLRVRAIILLVLAGLLVSLQAQDDPAAPEQISKPPVSIVFTPPDLEGRIVLGIFDASGKLQRTLRFDPGAPGLTIDTNGYIAQWDGLDEAGKPCAGGRYSARGYVVGDEVEVEGESFYFNDWMAEDQIPAEDVKLRQWPEAIGVELKTAKGPVLERIQTDGSLAAMGLSMGSGDARTARGREETTWMILDLEARHVVVQLGKDNVSLRELRVPKDEPQPVEILASSNDDSILLKETGPGGVQRVRMLKRGETASEKDGRVVADWEVVFERTLEPCAKFGLVDGRLVPDAGTASQTDFLTVPLIENALEPGRKNQLRFRAVASQPGSALVSPEGLELVGISAEGGWNRFSFSGDGSAATLYQGDGIVVEEFAIRGLDHVAAFDAGTFLLGAPSR